MPRAVADPAEARFRPGPMLSLLRLSLPLLALAGVLGVTYRPTAEWMLDRWSAAGSYYGHGYLIPPIALAWVFTLRRRLARAVRAACGAGFAVAFAGLALHAASEAFDVHFTSGLSMPVVLAGCLLALVGFSVFRVLLGPLLFLFFMVPLPLVAVSQATLSLKLFATEAGVSILSLIGLPVVQEGSAIHIGTETLMVGDACSGLRSLIALLAVGFLLVQRVSGGWLPRLLAYALVVPLAICGNVVRVVALCLIAHGFGAERLQGLVHDATGMLVYVVTLAGLLATVRLFEPALDAEGAWT